MNRTPFANPARRTILAGLAGTALAARAWAQPAEPIKIGIVLPKQGTFAELGEGAANAIAVILETAGSTILGRPARLIWLDDPNPQTAQQNMQKLIEEEKVSAIIGGASGATALALAALAKRSKMPFITLSGAAALTGKDCNRYTFRSQAPAPVAVRALAPALLAQGKRWYFLMPDYAYGQDVYAAYKAYLDAAGGTQVGYDKTPLGTTDFSGFILKIRQAKPDNVVTALSGNDLPALLKQYAEFGMKDGAPISSPIITDTDIIAAGPQASGIYGTVWNHNDPQNPPADNDFVNAYFKKNGKPPHSNAYLAAISMRLLMAGMAKAGSTNAEAIVRGIEGTRIEEGAFPVFFRAWDHQLMHRFLVMKVKPSFTDPWDALEVTRSTPETPAGLDALYGEQAGSACTLGDM